MKKHLQEGEQTKITDDIKSIANEFKSSGFDLVFEILNWIHKNLKQTDDKEFKKEFFRKRTADEIIKSGRLTGCTDYALVFISLVRAKGIPAKYTETIRESWLEKPDMEMLEGHVFSEVEINEEWYIVDPQGAVIKAWYGKRFQKIADGLDSWDIGIRSLDDLKKEFLKYKDKTI
jgi:hypothetical protein